MPLAGNPELSRLRLDDPEAARERVRDAMIRAGGSVAMAARELGVGRRTLNRWLAADPQMRPIAGIEVVAPVDP